MRKIYQIKPNNRQIIKGIVVFNKSIPNEKNRVIYQRLKTLSVNFSITLLTDKTCVFPKEIRNKIEIVTPPISFINIPIFNNFLGRFFQRIFFKIWSLIFVLRSKGYSFIYTFALPPNYIVGFLAKNFKDYFWILEMMHTPMYYLNSAKLEEKSLIRFFLLIHGFLIFLLSKLVIRNADLVLATSHSCNDGCSKILSQSFGVCKEKLLPIQQGIFIFKNVNSKRFDRDKQDNYINIMYIGAITKTKGSVILKTLGKLLQEIKTARFIIIGPAPRLYIKQINQTANDKAKYLGTLSHEEALNYMSKADICICTLDRNFPDNSFAQPVKLLEYLSFGKPVVATNLEGIRGIITDGFNGLLYEPGDINSFLDKVKKLVEDPDLRIKLSNNALESVRRYDWKLLNNKVMEEIKKRINIKGGK